MASDIITIVFTDLVKSTDVKALLPGDDLKTRNQHFLDHILTPHRKRMETGLETFQGRVVKTAGDSYFIVFPDAADAVRWAVAVQRSHAHDPIPTPLGPLMVKIGMHTGAPMTDPASPEDFVGNEVDYAARVAALAEGGQIVLSETTAALARAAVIDGVTTYEHGDRELKGIGRAPIFELLYDDREARPLKQAAIAPSNLPQPPQGFVNRTEESARLRAHLRRGGVTILKGGGGFGKTSLARTVAQAAYDAGELEGGVAWIHCERKPRFAECMREVTEVFFGARPKPSEVAADAELVLRRLDEEAALVILDNYESTDSDPELVRWLASVRLPARVLVTTRQLPVGLEGHVIEVGELPRPDAVALFRRRARAAGLAEAELDRQGELISKLCAAVGDQPLAIEFLAARAVGLPLSRLLQRVQRDLTILDARGDPNRPDRHQSAADNLTMSYEQLTEPARDFLLRFTALPDGAGPEAVSQAMPTEDWDEAAEELVRQSLLRLENGRYSISPLLRQFAREQRTRQQGGE